MEKLRLRDIDLLSLKKLSSQGSFSTIYTDGNLCYKLLDGLYLSEKRDLYKKFLNMEGLCLNGVLLPEDLIMEGEVLQGYTMRYFRNSLPLSDKFLKRYFNCKELIGYVYQASKILRDIHKEDVICQDLSFENILVDDEGEIVFCDIDGCRYKENHSPFFSIVLHDFIVNYRKERLFSVENFDRVSMILSFCLLMYGERLQDIGKRRYCSLSDYIHTLENLRRWVDMLVNKRCVIGEVPYLDEVIDLTDDYVIERRNTLVLRR